MNERDDYIEIEILVDSIPVGDEVGTIREVWEVVDDYIQRLLTYGAIGQAVSFKIAMRG
uniref:Uncharacterized protein n=1 Tax=viral metagenome TaxID=1070528 RepID=A0A6M3Y5X0_9ZZZZ